MGFKCKAKINLYSIHGAVQNCAIIAIWTWKKIDRNIAF